MAKYKNVNPLGDKDAYDVLQTALDNGMVQNLMEKIEQSGEDMLIVICNLHDQLGRVVAKYNTDYKEDEDNDLWVFALDKDNYKELMYEHGANDEGDRMKPLDKQIVVYSAGISHYFTAKGRYSGRSKGQHWAQFRRRDLH